MNDLQTFTYQSSEVRTVQRDGAPWFVLRDVCQVLGISKYRDTAERLDPDERGSVRVDTPGGPQEMTAVNESGLYHVILRSDKPEAKPFRKWVTAEVLPAIRRHGLYATPDTVEKMLADPDTTIQLLSAIKEERAARQALEVQAAVDRPKVLFADAVSTAKTSILVGEMAKLLKQNGVDIGQNRFFAWLREKGYLIRRSGTDYNMPTQRSMELGLFEIKETAITNADGSVRVTRTTKVTGKGQQYFINLFLTGAAAS